MRTSDWSSDVCSSDLRVGVADRRLEKSLGISGRIGRHDLEAGDMSVPAGIVLAVLGRDPGGCAVRAAEHDRASQDRKSVVLGKSVSVRVVLGGCLSFQKKNQTFHSFKFIHHFITIII